MASNKLQNIIDTIIFQGEIRFLPATTKAQISAFESIHKLKLPAQYREWLLFSDGGELFLPAGVQLYGIEHKPVIDVEDMPDTDYIAIGALASGDPVVFEKGKEQISIYNLEADKIETNETYDDFFAFLDDLSTLQTPSTQPLQKKGPNNDQ